MSRVPYLYLVIGLLALACRSDEEAQAASSSVAAADSSTNSTPDAAKAPRDTSPASPTDRMTRMQSVIDTATLPTVQAIVATHPQMVDSMVNSMTDEMKRMNMMPSAEWTALRDSCMKDLDKLGTVSTSQLVPAFREHHARLTRLVQMHRSMMGRPPAA